MDERKLFVVAIDFGTTFSGYAFSTRSKPTEIYKCEWRNADLTSSKTPTSILLDEDKKFVAFGFDAEKKYLSSILPEDETDDYYYFRRFKMMLHKEKKIDLETELQDETGKSMKAIDVFSKAINYLKEEAKKKLKSTLAHTDESDIQYVITVPAIWEDGAKLFMRKAAEMTGIKSDQLMIALEPEAASISCEELKTVREGKNFSSTIKEGTKYVVVDLGGGTADITVHESKTDGILEEVCEPSGGPWGGTTVDDRYLTFLKDLFGEKVIAKLKHDDLEDYTDVLYSFEVKKRTVKVRSDDEKDIVITLPYELIEITKELQGSVAKAIEASKFRGKVTVSGQKLYIPPSVFRVLFDPTINQLISHLQELLKKSELSGLNYIVMVGGFSECELIQKAIKDTFGTGKRPAVIIPDEAGLAVLKGAVLFGHEPKKINKRVLKKTYGIQSWPDFDPDIHPANKKVMLDGDYRCKDIFFKFAEKGKKVEVGFRQSQTFQALRPDEKSLELSLYSSEDKNPRYITDPTCQRLGRLRIPLPPIRKGEKLEIEESIIFGDTELLFVARNLKTGEKYETQFIFN